MTGIQYLKELLKYNLFGFTSKTIFVNNKLTINCID